MKQKLEEINRLKTAYEEKLKTQAQPIVMERLREFFAEAPEVLAVRWRQYTPSWNDGEPCEFRVSDILYQRVGGDPESGDHGDGYEYQSDFLGSERKAMQKLEKDFRETDDELFLIAFGDHTMITATREKIEVEEYEHE